MTPSDLSDLFAHVRPSTLSALVADLGTAPPSVAKAELHAAAMLALFAVVGIDAGVAMIEKEKEDIG